MGIRKIIPFPYLSVLTVKLPFVIYNYPHSHFQLGGPENVAEMTGRRGMLVRASGGKGVVYQARNT